MRRREERERLHARPTKKGRRHGTNIPKLNNVITVKVIPMLQEPDSISPDSSFTQIYAHFRKSDVTSYVNIHYTQTSTTPTQRRSYDTV